MKNENEEKYKNNKLLGNEIQLINNSNKIKINELIENNNNNLLTINNGCNTSPLLNNIVDKIEKDGEEEEEEGIMKEEIEEGVEQQQQQQYKQQFYFQFIQQYIQQLYKQGNNKNIIDIYQNFGKNSKSLKEELNGIFNGINIDKVFGDFSSQELYSNVNRLFSTLQKNVHQTNEQFGGFFLNNINSSSSFPIQYSSSSSLPSRILNNNNMPFLSSLINSSSFSSSFSSSSLPFNAFLTITQNPLIATAMSTALANSFTKQQQQNLINNQNGIFPTKIITETNKFINQSPTSRPIINLQKYLIKKENDGSPRKKRQKVTDSVRGPRSNLHCREQINYSTTTSERSTPGNGGYLPPTMVHSHNQIFRSPDKDGSPSDDEEKDNNNYFINESLKSQLTHVHLRKAKLMFFYQRYPSSSVLKSYFPDVKFNKHNTAQIIVTSESEIFKQLNQHYNKNNVFQPPERLQFVVQETLREFFNALKEQRDLEPSWKKSIYKIIQQLDEPIPEYFRDSQFVEILENAP
ncbi:Prospero domain-containing protein [Meloidogyne graminicola]|uniref:Prospero domain-containing protein n=1 Tax=Meloidogyne graminicola TaxID=189291 RepID=A0A8S9ZZ85_9BILA|nr:Prospero domain-containing protein [Meloidogyne graminicola]